ncbi:MAG: BadF/BadG/BcrA/BcrD ATPase family protein [Marmoricola sp.]
MTVVVGVDIGGTHSRARLARDGHTVAEADVGSASLTAVGAQRATTALSELTARLGLAELGPVDAICIGSAGSGSTDAHDFLTRSLAPMTRSGTVLVVNDARLILPAAGLDEGIALIGGTGSTAVGVASDRVVRAGGWGYLLGDEGSGYWTVRAAVRELADRQDRGAELGELGRGLLTATGAHDVPDLVQRFYDHPDPDGWARHAGEVLDSGDPAAEVILARTAGELATLVDIAAARLHGAANLPVVLAGGLLTGYAPLALAVRERIQAALPAAQVSTLTEPPVAGAVRLAAAAATTP